jgi:hypothetical protein
VGGHGYGYVADRTIIFKDDFQPRILVDKEVLNNWAAGELQELCVIDQGAGLNCSWV